MPTPRVTSSPPPRANPLRYRTIPIIFGSITLFAFSSYCTYVYITLSRTPAPTTSSLPSTQSDVSSRYNTIARSFDTSVDWTEKVLRITKLRKKLLSQAHGDVLEVSIGTGRNLEYYNWGLTLRDGKGKEVGESKGKVKSFTAVDISEEMVNVAREKFLKLFPGKLGTRWIVGDASTEIPSPPMDTIERDGTLGKRKYDTVIQTMGLCSANDPVALLKNLGDCVKEDSGRILLLEHGRGNWKWLNGVLDKFAEGHAKEFGCWWNRDLEGIIKDSGLDIVDMYSVWWHGGTTWWIELKKPKAISENTEDQDIPPKLRNDEEAKKKWW